MTNQYADGPYLITWPDGKTAVAEILGVFPYSNQRQLFFAGVQNPRDIAAALNNGATLTPLVPAPAMPQPDWSTAPERAGWWAVDAGGQAYFYDVEPTIGVLKWWAAKDAWVLTKPESVDLPIGVDWRTTLTKRPR